MGLETGTALLISSLVSAAAAGTQAAVSAHQQEKTREAQAAAQNEAEQKQKEADDKAEKKRLEGLAANQEATDYGNIWGTEGNKYADAAQKLSAGTGNFNTDDDENNPFYTRGLL